MRLKIFDILLILFMEAIKGNKECQGHIRKNVRAQHELIVTVCEMEMKKCTFVKFEEKRIKWWKIVRQQEEFKENVLLELRLTEAFKSQCYN